MTLKICLRCDWQGETKEPTCPNCGVPLYVVGTSPSGEAGVPGAGHPEEPSREAASTPSSAPSGTLSPQSDRTPARMDAVGSPRRSDRSTVAFVLAGLALTLAMGTWLKAHEERLAAATSIDAVVHESPAGDGSPTQAVLPLPTPSGRLGPSEILPVGRHSLIVDGVPFSFSVPSSGWERFGNLYISKSTVGPQGAEAIIFWTDMDGSAGAESCGQWWGSPVGSIADFARHASRADGTELVTGPSDVTVGGRAAEYLALTVREDLGCDPGFLYTWPDAAGGAFWTSTDVGDTMRVWLVKVGRTVLFIGGTTHEGAGSDLEQEIQQIVGSIRFD